MGARAVLLVGSVPLENSEAEFRTTAHHLGRSALALPDGETGDRLTFVGWFSEKLGKRPEVEVAQEIPLGGPIAQTLRLYRMKPGNQLTALPLRPMGYAEVAKKSYEDFTRIRAEGVIPDGTLFQVSLPTALILSWFLKEPFAERIPVLEKAVLAEVTDIAEAVPAKDLLIQWDVALEIQAEEAARYPDNAPEFLKRDWSFEQGMASLARMCDGVPRNVRVGVHFCYGDPDGKHIIQPRDMSVMVDSYNALATRVTRPIEYVHMPVPIDRNDDPYFAPLDKLKREAPTRLFLGVVHPEEGVPGARVKLAAARPHASDFGVACECGLGRRPPASIPALLDLHREVAA